MTMKFASALLFASAVAAEYVNYAASSSLTGVSQLEYPTIHPSHGKPSITVTSQHQVIPTYIPAKSNSSTGSWSDYAYLSTVINDYDGKAQTITKTDQLVTVYHTKATISHTSTAYSHAAPSAGYNSTTNATVPNTWYEVYEKVYEAPYNNLGPHALPAHPGSGLYKGDANKQPVKVKEYKGGKWTQYIETLSYGAPEPVTTTYAHPGTYTVPAYDITLDEAATVPAEATCTAHAGTRVTYGGASTVVDKATTITALYGAYEISKAANGKSSTTRTIVRYTTITCPHAGTYEVVKPSTTSVDKDTEIAYPTTRVHKPGVYHHTKETVTVTKSHQAYTCKYQQSSLYATSTDMSTPSGYSTSSGDLSALHPTHTDITTPLYSSVSISSHPANPYPTNTKPSSTSEEETYPQTSNTAPNTTDPSSDPDVLEPAESYGTPYSGSVKRGGVLERRKAAVSPVKKAGGKRVILL